MFFAFDFKETKMVIERLRGDRGRSLKYQNNFKKNGPVRFWPGRNGNKPNRPYV